MPKNNNKQKVLYPFLDVRLFSADPKLIQAFTRSKSKVTAAPLTQEIAKEILGWINEEDVGEEFGDDYLLVDYGGYKIRCLHNLNNRPFYPQVAEYWKLEILRGKWKLNGETVILDKYGNTHDGQHRLIGLILACQEWILDQEKPEHEQIWSQFWPECEPYIETLLVVGIESDDDTVNTIGTGRPRSFADVLYRSEYFDGLKNSTKKNLAKTADWAIRLVWDRTAQSQVSLCNKRSHSESLEFISRHERLLKAIRFIHELNKKSGDRLQYLITLGNAAGLLYLMGTANSELEKYEVEKNEKGLDFSTWAKAESFWNDLAKNGTATEFVRELLLKIPQHVQGQFGRDLRLGTIIKGWLMFVDDEEPKDIDQVSIETYEDNTGFTKLAEFPRIGGIDLEFSVTSKKKVGLRVNERKAEESSGECPHGGKHVWIEDDLGQFCEKCKETKTVKRRK